MSNGARARAAVVPAAVALTVALVAAACSATTRDARPVSGGTLSYLTSQLDFISLDPQRLFLPEDIALTTSFLQRTLTAYSYDAGPEDVELVPDLATGTGSPEAGGTRWSFTLRDGATFEDGSEITCADVKFGVARAFDPDVIMATGVLRAVRLLDVPAGPDGNPVYAGPYAADPGDVAAFDRAVSCSADDRTITFRLVRPAGDFGHAVSTPAFGPVPVGTPADARYDTAPISSGPYRVEAHAPAQGMTLVRNDAWDAGADPLRPAYPDRIEVELGLDPRDIEARLTADEGADRSAIAAPVDPVAAPAFEPGEALAERVLTGPGLGVRYLAINTDRVPLAAHRQAIAAAVDRAALDEALGGDRTGTPAGAMLPPGLRAPSPGSDPAAASAAPAADPDQARELLAGVDTPLPPLSLAVDDSPANQAAAAVLAQSLAAAGIELTTLTLEPADYYPAIRDPASPHALMLSSWAPPWWDAAPLADLLTQDGGATNLARYDDPEVGAAAAAAAGELDPSARATAWTELDARVVDEAAVVPLRFDRQLRLVGSRVRDAHAWAPYGSVAFGALWVESAD